MVDLTSMSNKSGMGCDVVAMLLVGVVMCWEFMVLVWLSLWFNV